MVVQLTPGDVPELDTTVCVSSDEYFRVAVRTRCALATTNRKLLHIEKKLVNNTSMSDARRDFITTFYTTKALYYRIP